MSNYTKNIVKGLPLSKEESVILSDVLSDALTIEKESIQQKGGSLATAKYLHIEDMKERLEGNEETMELATALILFDNGEFEITSVNSDEGKTQDYYFSQSFVNPDDKEESPRWAKYVLYSRDGVVFSRRSRIDYYDKKGVKDPRWL